MINGSFGKKNWLIIWREILRCLGLQTFLNRQGKFLALRHFLWNRVAFHSRGLALKNRSGSCRYFLKWWGQGHRSRTSCLCYWFLVLWDASIWQLVCCYLGPKRGMFILSVFSFFHSENIWCSWMHQRLANIALTWRWSTSLLFPRPLKGTVCKQSRPACPGRVGQTICFPRSLSIAQFTFGSHLVILSPGCWDSCH